MVVRYGNNKIHYGVVSFGPNSEHEEPIPLSSDVPTEKELEAAIKSAKITSSNRHLNCTKVVDVVSEIMNSSKARKDAEKVAVVMYDQPPEQEEQQIEEATKRLQEEEILLVTVPFVSKNASDPNSDPKDDKKCITKNDDHCVIPGPVSSDTPLGLEPIAEDVNYDADKEAEKIGDAIFKGNIHIV